MQILYGLADLFVIGKYCDVDSTTSVSNGAQVIMFLCLGIVLLSLRGGIVSLIDTPAEAVAGIRDYLTVCFIGIPFIMAYNIIANGRGLYDAAAVGIVEKFIGLVFIVPSAMLSTGYGIVMAITLQFVPDVAVNFFTACGYSIICRA